MKAGKRFSKAERAYHLREWKKSGLTQVSYSKASGLILSTLRYWSSQARKSAGPGGASSVFVPLIVPDDKEHSLEVTIELPKGIRITVQGQVSPAYIKSLIS